MLRRHLVPSLRKTALVKPRQTFELCIAQFGHCARESWRKHQFFASRSELLGSAHFLCKRISDIVLSRQEHTGELFHNRDKGGLLTILPAKATNAKVPCPARGVL